MSVWHNIFCVITAPRYGWEVINDSNIPAGKVFSSAYRPLLFALGLSCFVPMIYDSTIPFSSSLMKGIVMCSTYFVSYFSILYLLSSLYPDLVKTEGAKARLNDYILYNLIFLLLLMILRNLLPSAFTPVYFLLLYLPWMAYKGTGNLFVSQDKVNRFTIVSSVLLVGFPLLVEYLLGFLVI